jgi:hypothetical protein
MQNREWRARFRERVSELLKLFAPADELIRQAGIVNERLKQVLARVNPQAAQDQENRFNQLKERLIAHAKNLEIQNSQSDPRAREFDDNGRLVLTDWYKVSESPDSTLELIDLPKGIKAYSILCGPNSLCNASWRCKTMLAKGTYVFHASLKTSHVTSKDEKNQVGGAGIYISGTTRKIGRKGDANWGPLKFEFTVQEEIRTVEFIAELRAKKGQVWYDATSFYLTRKSKE